MDKNEPVVHNLVVSFSGCISSHICIGEASSFVKKCNDVRNERKALIFMCDSSTRSNKEKRTDVLSGHALLVREPNPEFLNFVAPERVQAMDHSDI